MLMGWDYVSELRPPTGLLFIPQVMYGHEEPWWNDVDMGKLLICLPEHSLAVLPAELSSSKSGGSGWRKWCARWNGTCGISLIVLFDVMIPKHQAHCLKWGEVTGRMPFCMFPWGSEVILQSRKITHFFAVVIHCDNVLTLILFSLLLHYRLHVITHKENAQKYELLHKLPLPGPSQWQTF
jgi:hypothetical protein